MNAVSALHCSSPMNTLARSAMIFVAAACVLTGCDKEPGPEAAARAWQAAEAKWERRDIDAYRAWTEIPEKSTEGMRARQLLEQADRRYREGITRFAKGDLESAKRAFAEGAASAPMNPKHYLTLAQMYELQGLHERAAKYYAKFAQALPDSPKADDARAAARDVAPGFEGVFDPPTHRPPEGTSALAIAAAAAGSALLAAVLLFLLMRPGLGAGGPLGRLIEQAPEMHTAVAYLIGSLRHELLKHRIGPAADVIQSLASGSTTGPQRVYLSERLFEGVPLDEAWRAHMDAFVRVLGTRFNPKRDREFQKAERAVLRIAGLRESILSRSPSAVRPLSEARTVLMAFDKQLALLQSKLVRTRVDTALLEQAAAEVRGEYAAGAVALDDLFIEEVEGDIAVEVPRGDLLLILKNVLRNAVMAVGRNPSDRRVGMGVRLGLEPTGEETVRLCVSDTNPEIPSPIKLTDGRPTSGLGLVTLAVKRYGGSLQIRPDEGSYVKTASICFFRAFDETEGEAEK